jgi:hypothetical protein
MGAAEGYSRVLTGVLMGTHGVPTALLSFCAFPAAYLIVGVGAFLVLSFLSCILACCCCTSARRKSVPLRRNPIRLPRKSVPLPRKSVPLRRTKIRSLPSKRRTLNSAVLSLRRTSAHHAGRHALATLRHGTFQRGSATLRHATRQIASRALRPRQDSLGTPARLASAALGSNRKRHVRNTHNDDLVL